jgi:hypothetical protein
MITPIKQRRSGNPSMNALGYYGASNWWNGESTNSYILTRDHTSKEKKDGYNRLRTVNLSSSVNEASTART